MGQEVDIAAQSGQPDGNVQRAAADVLGRDRAIHDVDQGFTYHQPACHVDRLR
jgi:hypothetical protein